MQKSVITKPHKISTGHWDKAMGLRGNGTWLWANSNVNPEKRDRDFRKRERELRKMGPGFSNFGPGFSNFGTGILQFWVQDLAILGPGFSNFGSGI